MRPSSNPALYHHIQKKVKEKRKGSFSGPRYFPVSFLVPRARQQGTNVEIMGSSFSNLLNLQPKWQSTSPLIPQALKEASPAEMYDDDDHDHDGKAEQNGSAAYRGLKGEIANGDSKVLKRSLFRLYILLPLYVCVPSMLVGKNIISYIHVQYTV